ncbi:MAG: glycoside hydrolase family 5 protein [Fibrobacteraceae bacterium]|nr:glycoside hydrolase family 5 protein [Fibrobacteraceae bacterium]
MNIAKALLLSSLLAFGVTSALADAASAKPLRVGPVQIHGALGTSGGKIIGQKSNRQVMLRGMSLFWSDATGIQYYNPNVIAWAANSLGIDVFRFAMGIEYYDSNGGTSNKLDANYSYKGNPSMYMNKLDQMVEAAIENDIYIIVDWHSHRAENEKSLAQDFFKTVAQKYAKVPNVIFEVYNEPVNTGWSTIVDYANSVISGIRAHSQNLALVGTPNWSQLTNVGGVSGTNVGYVFHFYAATHSLGSFQSRITSAINGGNAVFITEWGTTNADGDGEPSANNTSQWTSFMDQNNISNCNWSLRNQTSSIDGASEKSALLAGSNTLTTQSDLESASYTTSGNIVKSYLTGKKRNWADSLIAGKTSGSCHFATQSVKETAGTVTLKSGCTYTSSDESVVTGSGAVKSAGFAILTGNDNSQSIVLVTKEPKQTIAKFASTICRYSGSCGNGWMLYDLTNSGKLETLISASGETAEGSKVTFKSLNTDIVDYKKAVCNNSSKCYGDTKGASVHMLEFKTFGDAKIVATAPATTGFQAMNDTIVVTYGKGLNKFHSKVKFGDAVIPLGGSSVDNFFCDTLLYEHAKVSYTFDGEATSIYASRSGNILKAANKNAIVMVTASSPETSKYEAFNKTVRIVIGDSTKAENVAIPVSKPLIPFRAEVQNQGLMLQVDKAGLVSWSIRGINGVTYMENSQVYQSGSHWISLDKIPAGFYIMNVKQGSKSYNFKWNKQ